MMHQGVSHGGQRRKLRISAEGAFPRVRKEKVMQNEREQTGTAACGTEAQNGFVKAMKRYAIGGQTTLLGLFTALFVCGLLCGAVAYYIIGKDADSAGFFHNFVQTRAFSSYGSAKDYFQFFASWFIFYEKYLAVLLVFAFTLCSTYFGGGVCFFRGALTGFSAAVLAAGGFAWTHVAYIGGHCILAMLLIVFACKAVCFSSAMRSRARSDQPLIARSDLAALVCSFFLFSAALALLLLLSSCCAQLAL